MKFAIILATFLLSSALFDKVLAEVYTTGSTCDNNGNITVIGYCLGNIKIGGQQFSINTPSAFIIRLNSHADMIWIKFITSSQSINANAIAVDSSGSIYITGYFSGAANFDSYLLTSQRMNAFVVKYDLLGNVEWVKQGVSNISSKGNDVYVSGEMIYICGDGNNVSFDSLSIGERTGFTVVFNSNGIIQRLLKTLDFTYSISVDTSKNIIISGGKFAWSPALPPYGSLAKFSATGDLIWTELVSLGGSLCTDNNNNIFFFAVSDLTELRYLKYSPNGSLMVTKTFGSSSNNAGRSIIFSTNGEILSCGYFSSNMNFGNTAISSIGFKDAFLAKLDTNLNPIWIRTAGGTSNDEFTKVSIFNNGEILTSGNFRGTVKFGNSWFSGGKGVDDLWVGAAKLDNDGNIIWFKKLAEDFSVIDSTNWFPLQLGNQWHLYGYIFGNYYGTSQQFLMQNFYVIDTISINGYLYYKVNDFFNFPIAVVRFDQSTQRLIIRHSNADYTYMDFSKIIGESFLQIQPNGIFLPATIVHTNIILFDDTLQLKGFSRTSSNPTGAYYFSPEIGWILQDETPRSSYGTDLQLIEYKVRIGNTIRHKKHSYLASIQFQPIHYIPNGNRIMQVFKILHHYSRKNYPNNTGYFSYMKTVYLQSFYSNNNDTIWNNKFIISQLSESDYSLNYQFDTTRYLQGYNLYYRIVAIDKGIVPDTFYMPQSSYYKLFWKDSTTSLTDIDFEVNTFSLLQNYPNPCNDISKITFTIPQRNIVSLKVYNILGSEIVTLLEKEIGAGKHEVIFSGKGLSSGVYIYQLKSGNVSISRKLILLK